MLGILIAGLLALGIWLMKSMRNEDKKLLSTYAFISMILIVICINVLFVLNVEAVHFVQYAVFAIICFQLTNSYFRTMFWSMLAGAVDELYQYVYLAPERTLYYDFNDVLINGVGAGIGLIIIRTVISQSHHIKWNTVFRSIECKVFVGIILFIIIGFITGHISYGPNEQASFCFMKKSDIGFWRLVYPKGSMKFHVVKPMEGFFFAIGLLVLYSGLQRGSVDISKRSENN